MSKTILITGGCGFVGSNLATSFKKKYPSYSIFCLDNLHRKGSELNVPRLKDAGIQFVRGDIRSKEDINEIPHADVVIDAAAEPSVLAGLDGSSDYLIHTNFNGTVHSLDFAVKHRSDFIFLSTSRIYPIQNIEAINFIEQPTRFAISSKQTLPGISDKGIAENFLLSGVRSLYGATKLASELMVEEYNEWMNLKTVINRCGVIAGPGQMGKVDQGVTVLWVARHFWKKDLSYIGYGGEGKQVRDILHIDDLFSLVDFQVHNMEKVNKQIFNVGGGNDVNASLMELTELCREVTGNKISIHKEPETRKADVRIYITDNSKVTKATAWKPTISVKKNISDIYRWIKANEKQLEKILN